MKVYVAAPYDDAAVVRMVHERLSSFGLAPTSRWAERATGPEDFSRFSPEVLRGFAAQNDADVRRAGAVLAVARHGAGGEMFAEARMALEWGIPVVWVGRRTLSAFRPGVVRAEDLDDGIRILVDLARIRTTSAVAPREVTP